MCSNKQTNKQKTVDESPELLNVNNKSFICMCVPLVASFFSYSLKILNLIFILYCNTVDLQCVSFRCTAMCFTYTYTYIHSFSDSFSIQVITEYLVQFPVLYTRFLLVICFIYSSVCVLIPSSYFIPSSPVQLLLFFVCLFLSQIKII